MEAPGPRLRALAPGQKQRHLANAPGKTLNSPLPPLVAIPAQALQVLGIKAGTTVNQWNYVINLVHQLDAATPGTFLAKWVFPPVSRGKTVPCRIITTRPGGSPVRMILLRHTGYSRCRRPAVNRYSQTKVPAELHQYRLAGLSDSHHFKREITHGHGIRT